MQGEAVQCDEVVQTDGTARKKMTTADVMAARKDIDLLTTVEGDGHGHGQGLVLRDHGHQRGEACWSSVSILREEKLEEAEVGQLGIGARW